MILAALIVSAAIPLSGAPSPETMATSRSLRQFAECFRSVQDLQRRPWAFVPNERGGTFSGANGSTGYELKFSEGQPMGELVLLPAEDEQEQRAVKEALNRCR